MIELLLQPAQKFLSHRRRKLFHHRGAIVTDSPEDLVLLDVRDGVGLVTWNRPDRNNAYSVPLEAAYYQRLKECEQDPAVRVIVVTGAGKSFCPGMDSNTLSAQAN